MDNQILKSTECDFDLMSALMKIYEECCNNDADGLTCTINLPGESVNFNVSIEVTEEP